MRFIAPLLLFRLLCLFRIPASSFSISGDAFGSSGLLFLVARPGATSSIQPSSKTYGRHTYQAQILETGVNTHAHTTPQSALSTPCVKRVFAQQLCTQNADIGAPENY